ncbi:hypothetical protein [Aquimarina aquimarini]|uniref:hypothetical protein n=1 Tax=Aquimarina aquimarini TaxID=1191734 RepID=UPI000D555528|nr:hypothetical protein [Aquimarina aquimarini]
MKIIKLKHQILTLLIISIFFSCSNDDDSRGNNDSSLQITSITPMLGQEGDQITITVNKSIEEATLFFNDVKAAIISMDATNRNNTTTITTNIPQGAKTGKIKIMANQEEAQSDTDFTVKETPLSELLSITPMTGKPGDEITIIIKKNLSEIPKVLFGTKTASIASYKESIENGIVTITLIVNVPSEATNSIIYIKSNDDKELFKSQEVFTIVRT